MSRVSSREYFPPRPGPVEGAEVFNTSYGVCARLVMAFTSRVTMHTLGGYMYTRSRYGLLDSFGPLWKKGHLQQAKPNQQPGTN